MMSKKNSTAADENSGFDVYNPASDDSPRSDTQAYADVRRQAVDKAIVPYKKKIDEKLTENLQAELRIRDDSDLTGIVMDELVRHYTNRGWAISRCFFEGSSTWLIIVAAPDTVRVSIRHERRVFISAVVKILLPFIIAIMAGVTGVFCLIVGIGRWACLLVPLSIYAAFISALVGVYRLIAFCARILNCRR